MVFKESQPGDLGKVDEFFVGHEMLLVQRLHVSPASVTVTLKDAKLLPALVDLTLQQYETAAESLAEKLVRTALKDNGLLKPDKTVNPLCWYSS